MAEARESVSIRTDPVLVYLGLGANLGDPPRQIAAALERLRAVPGVSVLRVSALHETEPVGGPPQPRYHNGVAELETTLPAIALLHLCKQIEVDAGREPDGPRNGPRPLDLDILLYGHETIDTRDLQVPHPRLHEREFVLGPLRELRGSGDLELPPGRPAVLYAPAAFAAHCARWTHGGCRVGLVPTMGALHAGHASLLRRARQDCDRVAATIFVNPLQFGVRDDLDHYPRQLAQDLTLLAETGVDAVYAPSPDAVYPPGFATRLSVGVEAEDLEGRLRPGHFSGVVTIVAKLLDLARPDAAYFGQKDAQQVAVIRRMMLDLDHPVELCVCPIVREADGLAMSSRNVHLDAEDRRAAPVLCRSLRAARTRFQAGERNAEVLLEAARELLAAQPRLRVEYLELRREGDLAPLPAGPVTAARMLVAAVFGEARGQPTRLIDNLGLDGDERDRE